MKNGDKAKQAVIGLASTPSDHNFDSWNHMVETLEAKGLDKRSAYMIRLSILRLVGQTTKANKIDADQTAR